MNYLVCYDVPDIYPNIRRKISQACEDFGLIRIQYSVFWGTMTAAQARDLGVRCVNISKNVPIDIRFIAVCSSCFSKSFAVIHNSLLNTYGTSPLNSNPIYSAVGHHDVGWGIVNPNSNPISNPHSNPNPPVQPVPVSQASIQVPNCQSPSQMLIVHDSPEVPQVLPLQKPTQQPQVLTDELDTKQVNTVNNEFGVMNKESIAMGNEPTAEDLIKMMGYNDINQFDKEVSKALRPKKSRSKKADRKFSAVQTSTTTSVVSDSCHGKKIDIEPIKNQEKEIDVDGVHLKNLPEHDAKNDVKYESEHDVMKGKVVNFEDLDIELGVSTNKNLMEPQFAGVPSKKEESEREFLNSVTRTVLNHGNSNSSTNLGENIKPTIKGSIHRGSVDIDVFIV